MGRILVVDDDVAIQQVITEVLAFEGHEVLHAMNGQQGIEVARQEQPDLILMDLMMPVMDGRQAIAHLRADPETQHLRIIAMSAAAMLFRHAPELQADSTLAKPFDIAELLADVEVHLHRLSGG